MIFICKQYSIILKLIQTHGALRLQNLVNGRTDLIGTFKIWKERNPTIKTGITASALNNRRCKTDQLLTKIIKDSILDDIKKKEKKNLLECVPPLCSTIRRRIPLHESLNSLTRTEVSVSKHKACVCVFCDCVIIGVEKIFWLSESQLKAMESVRSVDFLEALKGQPIPPSLRNQYLIKDNPVLSNLLLSPRAHVKDGKYMSCVVCYKNICNVENDKPTKYAISNNWCIGEIPKNLIDGDIDDILAVSVAIIRLFANVFSYTAGAHKAIKGHHVFFLNDSGQVGTAFKYIVKSGVDPDMYVMICGRVTPAQ